MNSSVKLIIWQFLKDLAKARILWKCLLLNTASRILY